LAQVMICLAGIQEVIGLEGPSKQIYEQCLKLIHDYFHILYKSSLGSLNTPYVKRINIPTQIVEYLIFMTV
jgi:hypothetical protein